MLKRKQAMACHSAFQSRCEYGVVDAHRMFNTQVVTWPHIGLEITSPMLIQCLYLHCTDHRKVLLQEPSLLAELDMFRVEASLPGVLLLPCDCVVHRPHICGSALIIASTSS